MRRPYSVLLPVGFTVPPPLPETRCALAAPFRPCLAEAAAVCFLWHCPWGHPRRALPGTVTLWSPDFPPARAKHEAGGRPALWLSLHSPIPMFGKQDIDALHEPSLCHQYILNMMFKTSI